MGNNTNSQSNKTVDDIHEKEKINGFVNVNK